MTDKQKMVIKKLLELYVMDKEPVSPTKVGLALGIEYDKASSYCSSAIKKAVAEKIIERVGNGKYKPIE